MCGLWPEIVQYPSSGSRPKKPLRPELAYREAPQMQALPSGNPTLHERSQTQVRPCKGLITSSIAISS